MYKTCSPVMSQWRVCTTSASFIIAFIVKNVKKSMEIQIIQKKILWILTIVRSVDFPCLYSKSIFDAIDIFHKYNHINGNV